MCCCGKLLSPSFAQIPFKHILLPIGQGVCSFVFMKFRFIIHQLPLLGKILRLVYPSLKAMLECMFVDYSLGTKICGRFVLKPENKEAKKTAVPCKDIIEAYEKESHH